MPTLIDAELLQILCCPETHQPLAEADPPTVEALNRGIQAGRVRNRAGEPVAQVIDGGLVREDRRFLYPIRQRIPVLLIDEALPLETGVPAP